MELASIIFNTSTIKYKCLSTFILIISGVTVFYLTMYLARKKTSDTAIIYRIRKITAYIYTLITIILIARIWLEGIHSLATFIGLISAGLTVAMHDTIANLAGWIYILWRRPFKVGDRIQIGNFKGDVIDTRLLEFSIIEIGNWINGEQSTGRIVHIPNNMILREPLANYNIGFEYIWNEIPVVITFESNWRKAKKILESIAEEIAKPLITEAEEQIREAAMKYMIHFKHLTPIVYTAVKDNGIQLTLRYIVKPRNRRNSEHIIWEKILVEFEKSDDIDFAYPTTRVYRASEEGKGIRV